MKLKIKEIVHNELFAKQDIKFKFFQAKLIPDIDINRIVGVRTPELQRLAEKLSKNTDIKQFLDKLPHHYYEENNLHAIIIENLKDFNESMSYTEKFLPYIDNWATCDFFSPKIFKKHPEEVYDKVYQWIKSNKTYIVRFGVKILMTFYLDEKFKPEMLDIIASIRHDDYYVKMVVAWYFSVALVKQYEYAILYIENQCLEKWTHNKSIQKAIESHRINNATKNYLKTLKLK